MDNNLHKLIEYATKPLDPDFLNQVYEKYNITEERCEQYLTFINSLLNKVFNTYLGDDCMDTTQRFEHFNWCWKTTADNSETFKPNNNFMVWMGDFLGETWYMQKDKTLMNDKVRTFWSETLNFNNVKTRSSLDLLVGFFNKIDTQDKETEKIK
jgi:hypothetical protein